jgi:hypothetical protein
MYYRVTIEEFEKHEPPKRVVCTTAPSWRQAVDGACEAMEEREIAADEDDA